MAVNVKMGVDIGGFTAGIREGQQILKGLNAEMKATDAEFKATGNAEQKMAQQTKTLNSQLNVQKGIFDQAQKALKKMEEAGIKPTDAAYQKMYATMMNAKAGMNEAQAALNTLGTGAETAAGKTDKLAQSMNSLNGKVSLEQVIGGIKSITDGLENAARLAIKLGEDIWNSVMDSARWADDTATMAQMYGIDIDTLQRMQKLVTNGMDTSVDSMLKSMDRLSKGVGKDSTEVMETLAALGLAQTNQGKNGGVTTLITEDQTELFWEAGRALMEMGKGFDKEAAAQTLFGKSWKELVPLFSQFKSVEEYNKALEGVNVVSEESVTALAELNDKYNALKGNFDTLKTEVAGALAPALTKAADALNGMLTSLLEYLKTEDGKKMLNDLSTAVSGLFDNLSEIDPATVVEGFTGVMNTVVDNVQWLFDHKDDVVKALEVIVAGWAGLKITGGILEIVKVVQGIKGLTGAGTAAAAGKAAGEAWGGGFAAAVMKAAPWLVGLYTLLNPAESATNETDLLYDEKTKELTKAGKEAGITMSYDEYMGWKETMHEPMYSAEGQAGFLWENQLLNGNAWVRVTKEQYDAVQKFYDYFRNMGPEEDIADADWDAFEQAFAGQEQLFDLVNELFDHFTQTNTDGKLPEDLPEDFFKVTVEPEVPEDAASDISQKIGTVKVGVEFLLNGGGHSIPGLPGKANGIWSVPYDGYLAQLHRGERVVPAREVSSRSYNSNLYVENMNMNGGADAAGLAAAMAAAQRRTMSAYGS